MAEPSIPLQDATGTRRDIAADELADGRAVQVFKLGHGPAGVMRLVQPGDGLPVELGTCRAVPLAVGAGLHESQATDGPAVLLGWSLTNASAAWSYVRLADCLAAGPVAAGPVAAEAPAHALPTTVLLAPGQNVTVTLPHGGVAFSRAVNVRVLAGESVEGVSLTDADGKRVAVVGALFVK